MAENKKISELTRVSSLTGAEIVPFAKDGSNGAVTTAKLKEYAQPDLSAITTALGGKVDKVTGKGLSTNDYTNEEKAAVATIDNKVDKVSGKGLSANDYTDADKAKLTALPTNTQLTEKIDEAKLALFVDQWNAACGSYGKYNPANAPDAQHPFYLHHIWLTYKEAMDVMTAGSRQTSTVDEAYINQAIRTHLPRIGAGQVAPARQTFYSCVYLETVEMANLILRGAVFFNCQKLRSINTTEPAIYNLNGYPTDNFQNCVSLVEIRGVLRGNCDISFSDSPLLSLSSLEYMVSRAVNTQAITVTVHPDVYAKLTGDTTNAAAAALSADELAQWQSLVSAAAAKNIAFATTE